MAEAWQAAWERDKYEVGRAMHEGWKRQKIANGFADHPRTIDADGQGCCTNELHHADMIGWDDLPPEQQAINFEGGREGYRLGFEAGQQSVAEAIDRTGDAMMSACRGEG